MELTLLPVQQLFVMSPSPQIQALSLAFAQLGHFYSPEEIFYEAYLKTMSDQRRRGSQAFAWRDVDVSLAIVKQKIDARVMFLVTRKFLESRKISSVDVELVEDISADELERHVLAACSPDADHVLMLNYNAPLIHHVATHPSSVAIVESYDSSRKVVGMFEAEFSIFGLRWEAELSQLLEAGEVDSESNNPFGFIRLRRGSPKESKRLSNTFSDDGTEPNRKQREQVATFVE